MGIQINCWPFQKTSSVAKNVLYCSIVMSWNLLHVVSEVGGGECVWHAWSYGEGVRVCVRVRVCGSEYGVGGGGGGRGLIIHCICNNNDLINKKSMPLQRGLIGVTRHQRKLFSSSNIISHSHHYCM